MNTIKYIKNSFAIGILIFLFSEFVLRILPSKELKYRYIEKQNHCLHTDWILIVLCKNTRNKMQHPYGFSFWLTTNELGERLTPKIDLPKGEAWIIGDSISMGYGIDDQKSFPYLLSLKSNWKVRNLAVDSLGSAGIYKLLSEKLTSSLNEPDVIFWIFSHSDFLDDSRWFKLKNNMVYRFIYIAQFIAGKYFYTINFLKLALEKSNLSHKTNEYKNSTPKFPSFKHITFLYMQEVIKSTKRRKIPLYIILYPDKNLSLANNNAQNRFNRKIAHWIERNNASYINMESFFTKKNTINYYLPDGHPNEKSAKLFTYSALNIIMKINH